MQGSMHYSFAVFQRLFGLSLLLQSPLPDSYLSWTACEQVALPVAAVVVDWYSCLGRTSRALRIIFENYKGQPQKSFSEYFTKDDVEDDAIESRTKTATFQNPYN